MADDFSPATTPPGAPRESDTATLRVSVTPAADSASPPKTPLPSRMRVRAAKGGGTVVLRETPPEDLRAYTRLLDSIYDAVFITDARGIVEDMNPRALEVFRLPDETHGGFPVLRLISGADEALLRQVRQYLAEHRFTVLDARCIRADGTTFPAEIVVNNFDVRSRGGFGFFIRDITVRHDALDKLEAANERLRALDGARLEFISNVSHELRTPLTSMIYGIRSLKRGVCGPLPETASEYVERLGADCRRLLNTVNDILDMRRIDSGTLVLNKSIVPMARLVSDCVESLRIQASEKGLALQFKPVSSAPFCLCDLDKIERVVINIVGNSIKFTPRGGAIRLRVEPNATRQGYVDIVCDDTGCGIPPEAVSRVTERYFRVGQHVAGSGLGLSISREIVEMHGGRIKVASPVPGTAAGTSVRVSMPITTPPSILVVEDNRAVLDLLADEIASDGYHVLTATLAKEALEIAQSNEIGMAVFDLNLPDLNGAEAMLRLRSLARYSRLPLLAISGAEPQPAVASVLRRFRVPMLIKPWRSEDLLGRLANAFLVREGV